MTEQELENKYLKIPQEMKQTRRWICYKIEERDGKGNRGPSFPRAAEDFPVHGVRVEAVFIVHGTVGVDPGRDAVRPLPVPGAAEVVVGDELYRLALRHHVPGDPPGDPGLDGRVHPDPHVCRIPQGRVAEDRHTLAEDHVVFARIAGGNQIPHHGRGVEGIRVVPVGILLPVRGGDHLRELFFEVFVGREDGDPPPVRRKLFGERRGQGGFPGPGRAGDGYKQHNETPP